MNASIATRALALILAAGGAASAFADGDRERMNVAHPAYLAECGSCHVAFPPALLSADSWRAVMGGLDRHFGSDASLDPASTADITNFLVRNAAARPTTGPEGKPLLRITETRWFRKEHRDGHDGLTTAVFRSEPVKSAANCGACHRNAADGDYRERDIRIPNMGGRS